MASAGLSPVPGRVHSIELVGTTLVNPIFMGGDSVTTASFIKSIAALGTGTIALVCASREGINLSDVYLVSGTGSQAVTLTLT